MVTAIAVSTTAGVEKSFGERLGWKSNDVVVILHVDDVGMSHASNLGAIEATGKGVATSCSVISTRSTCGTVVEVVISTMRNSSSSSG